MAHDNYWNVLIFFFRFFKYDRQKKLYNIERWWITFSIADSQHSIEFHLIQYYFPLRFISFAIFITISSLLPFLCSHWYNIGSIFLCFFFLWIFHSFFHFFFSFFFFRFKVFHLSLSSEFSLILLRLKLMMRKRKQNENTSTTGIQKVHHFWHEVRQRWKHVQKWSKFNKKGI